jgi:hypothetical protein
VGGKGRGKDREGEGEGEGEGKGDGEGGREKKILPYTFFFRSSQTPDHPPLAAILVTFFKIINRK